jgi:flagellar basal-body rod protein FlgC
MPSSLSSPLIKAMYVATSGMQAQNQRVLIISQNLANAGTRAEKGEMPYQRQVISFHTVLDKKTGANLIEVKDIKKDGAPPVRIYSPGDPAADQSGYVYESNVKPMEEIADMREAGRSHEANLRAFEKILLMMQNTIGILKN